MIGLLILTTLAFLTTYALIGWFIYMLHSVLGTPKRNYLWYVFWPISMWFLK